MVVAINHFFSDTDAEITAVKAYVVDHGASAFLCKHWAQGSAGIEELAHHVVTLADSGVADFAPLYPDELNLFAKIETIARETYRADGVDADPSIRDQLTAWEAAGYGDLPVCIAKTQYSFTTNPKIRGAPTGFTIPVREVRLSAGAGFIVAICGDIMTMPGLAKVPSAEVIRINDQGVVDGLS